MAYFVQTKKGSTKNKYAYIKFCEWSAQLINVDSSDRLE